MKVLNIFFLSSLILFASSSCKEKKRVEKISIENIELPIAIKIKRYEQALFNIKKDNIKQEITKLQKDYAFFIGDEVPDSMGLLKLKEYLEDPAIRQLYEDCNKKYPNLNDIEKELETAFKYYFKYFPETKKTPEIYTFISGINPQAPLFLLEDSLVIIGLDMFLGGEYYTKYGIPMYIAQKFKKEYLVPDIFYQLAISKIGDCKLETFIDKAIYYGKIMYFMDAMLPNYEDSLKMFYNAKQIEWCRKNEKNIWAFVIDQKILFMKDQSAINKFIDDAPFSYHFGQNSPGRTGIWLGWQIVRSFMENNPSYTLKQLLLEPNSKKILNLSKYKPK
ncbi:MAG: hypothetical protein A2X12_12175 [Bacteroidetes bacterium GWE2_29_8]|nr:MAG: hypothetical protein A2X12_12175 [Bacteroidetes bacterium GWE2_29_8]OFY24587.1 MAG: hypothetical protein A2X02_03220 [Bacteroidetes bacterium GWF2_29_10]